MKKIEAIIAPGRLDDVQEALVAGGIDALTVSQVNVYDGKPGYAVMYRGVRYETDFHSQMKVELELDDDQVSTAVSVLQHAGRTDRNADEVILVLAMETFTEIEEAADASTADFAALHLPAASGTRPPISIGL
jgi:nitrogen regulatory protein P-II 1